jgi:hypothetical protein
MKNANDLNQLNTDSFYSKALPAKIDYDIDYDITLLCTPPT